MLEALAPVSFVHMLIHIFSTVLIHVLQSLASASLKGLFEVYSTWLAMRERTSATDARIQHIIDVIFSR